MLGPAAQQAWLRDPLWGAAQAMPAGTVFHRRQVVDEQNLRRRVLWADWLGPRDMADALSCTLIREGEAFWSLDVARGARARPFDQADAELLGRLVPHFIKAARIGQRLADRVAGESLALLREGAVLVDAQGCVRAMNAVAEATIATHAGFSLRGGVLALAAESGQQAAFARLVAGCCLASGGEGPAGERALWLAGAPGAVVSVLPYPGSETFGMRRGSLALVLVRVLHPPDPDALAGQLRRLFRLAPAEARLAAALADGKPLKEAGMASGIAASTARFYLEQIFRKTGTHRQSELVALLSALSRGG
jgi:DNA-binding CsgD family transcriptional regulator